MINQRYEGEGSNKVVEASNGEQFNNIKITKTAVGVIRNKRKRRYKEKIKKNLENQQWRKRQRQQEQQKRNRKRRKI